MKSSITTEQVLDACNQGIVATDADGNIVVMNKAAEILLGFDRNEVIGKNVKAFQPLIGDLVRKCLKTGNPQLGQHVYGKQLKIVVNVSSIQADNRIVGSVCNFEGMEEFELSAKRLRSYQDLNKQLEAIFNSSPDGIWVCDCSGEVIKVNESSGKLNKFKIEHRIGKNIRYHKKKGLMDRSATLEVLASEKKVNIMQYVPKTNKYLLVTGTPIFDQDGNISLVVVYERDMTALNSLQQQLEQSRMITEKYKDELVELSALDVHKSEIIAESEGMRQVISIAVKLARFGASHILILGESGTGKGLLAKFIHRNSNRTKKPFVQINCAALPESLLEAELFGYEKGAFTGARDEGKAGLFELAQEGTLFLDEIGDLPLLIQAKLLKYLDDQEIVRLGGTKSRKVDCIIIAATNRDINSLRKANKFRNDLFFRLNSFSINIPPLRERPEDIFMLTRYFVKEYSNRYGLKREISKDAVEMLQSYSFPGNVRELKNILERGIVLSEKVVLDKSITRNLEYRAGKPSAPVEGNNLSDEVFSFEKEILKKAMSQFSKTREMAKYLGVSQPTIVRKMKKYNLSFARYKDESHSR